MRFLLLHKTGTLIAFGFLTLVVIVGVASVRAYTDSTETVDWRDRTEVHIVLAEDGFHPHEVRIKKGTKVTFSTTRDGQFWPASNSHPAHDLYPAFDPMRPLEPGETWSFTVNDSGTWGIHDHIRAYYRGTLFVE